MDWTNIPSLAALRAFEAAVRTGSFSEAARELNVTHTSIAQHVRSLEAEFGQPLMRRAGRGMMATDAGAALARDLGVGFAEIAAGVRNLQRGRADRPVSLTTTPSFAETWLMPRLAGFWAAHPDVPLTVTTQTELVDLRRDGVDLAIRYGRGPWPGLEGEVLVRTNTVAVARPGLIGALPKVADCSSPEALRRLVGLAWIVGPNQPEFDDWLRSGGIDIEVMKRTEYHSNALILAACRAGAGVAAQPRVLVEQDLADGRLEVLAEEVYSGRSYHLLWLPGVPPARVKTFVTWLRRNLVQR